jgi:hypothetical protein
MYRRASAAEGKDEEEAGTSELDQPFIPSALVGALRAAVRSSPAPIMHLASRVAIKGITLDAGGRTLTLDGVQVSYTVQEWDLLAVFLKPSQSLPVRLRGSFASAGTPAPTRSSSSAPTCVASGGSWSRSTSRSAWSASTTVATA